MTLQAEEFELTLPMCVHTYGNAPCTASGLPKCHNSPATCKDQAHYTAGAVQIRWINTAAQKPGAIPSIEKISMRPQQLAPGLNMGVRESVTITFQDHKWDGEFVDKYRAERYVWQLSTFWRRWAAIWPNLKGMKGRVLRGDLGAPDAAKRINHYVVDSTSGPDANGTYTITLKDPLFLLDGETSVVPLPSKGVLAGDITDTATTLTLLPSGIGAGYPTPGVASIGDELVRYSISGDTVTLIERGYRGSKKGEHKTGETFQWAYVFSSYNAAFIIAELINSWTPVENTWIDQAVWEAEMLEFWPYLYGRILAKPMPVKKHINNLILEAGLVFFSDTAAKKIRLRSLRDQAPELFINDGNIIAGTFNGSPDYDARRDRVYYYYAQKNPLEKQDDLKNYQAILSTVTTDPIANLEDLPPAISTIYSEWVPLGAQDAAAAVSDKILQRYSRPPRKCSFKLPYWMHPQLGSVLELDTRYFVDAEGKNKTGKFLITQLEREDDTYSVGCEEITLSKTTGGTSRTVYIDADIMDADLKAMHDSLFTAASPGNTITYAIRNGAILGGTTRLTGFAAGINVVIDFIDGRMQGRGGRGAYITRFGVGETYDPPAAGGIAFYTNIPVTLNNPKIWGGGGGGSIGVVQITPPENFSRGGGGAGIPPGGAGESMGTPTAGGEGEGFSTAKGANGGGPGLPGGSVSGQAFGAAGYSIQGFSLCTITGTSDLRGPTLAA